MHTGESKGLGIGIEIGVTGIGNGNGIGLGLGIGIGTGGCCVNCTSYLKVVRVLPYSRTLGRLCE